MQSIHTFVVRTPKHIILVDTGFGNTKVRNQGGIPAFHMLDTLFLDRPAEVRVTPDDVDYAICTRLHTDHVGWNTRLINDEWVPTFTHARYILVESEWGHSLIQAERSEGVRATINDSVRPVIEAGLADLVSPDHQGSDAVPLEPSYSHTPGHVCIRIASQGVNAVISGDVTHSPTQCAHPDVRSMLDAQDVSARKARRAFLEHYADSGVLVLGTHFYAPSAGYIVNDGDAYRFEAIDGQSELEYSGSRR